MGNVRIHAWFGVVENNAVDVLYETFLSIPYLKNNPLRTKNRPVAF